MPYFVMAVVGLISISGIARANDPCQVRNIVSHWTGIPGSIRTPNTTLLGSAERTGSRITFRSSNGTQIAYLDEQRTLRYPGGTIVGQCR